MDDKTTWPVARNVFETFHFLKLGKASVYVGVMCAGLQFRAPEKGYMLKSD